MAKDELLGGFDLFVEAAKEQIRTIQDPAVKRELIEAMAAPVLEEARRTAGAMHGGGTLEKGIVSKTSTDGTQILSGWSKEASHGPLLEYGYHHIKSKKFIKMSHLRPALNAKKNEMRMEFGKLFYGKYWKM